MKKICALLVIISLLLPYSFSASAEDYLGSPSNPVTVGRNSVTMFEAEDLPVGSNYNYKIIEDPDASGGKVVGLDQYINKGDSGLDNSLIQYKIHAKVLDNVNQFYIWMRYKSTQATGSIAYSLNENPSKYCNLGESVGALNQYNWTTLRITETSLESINIVFRSNTVIDKIILSTDLLYFPTGLADTYKAFEIGVDSTDYSNLIYPLPPYTPKAERPRVMFNQEMFDSVKEKLKYEEHKTAFEEVVRYSELPAEKLKNPTDYMGCADANAFLYVLEGKKEYGRKAIETLITGMKIYNETSINSRDNISSTREMGNYVHQAARVYDWCYDLLTNEEKLEIIKPVLYFCASQEMGYPPTKQSGFTNAHDSENAIFRDMLAFAIATYEDFPEFYNNVAGKFFYEMLNFRNHLYEDSAVPVTGSDYGFSRLSYELQLACILRAVGWDGLLASQYKFGYYGIYDRRPDGYNARTGDCYSVATSNREYAENGYQLFYIGNFYRDPYIRQETYKDATFDVAYGKSLAPTNFLVINDPSIGLEPLSELPLSYFAGKISGTMYAKTGWEYGRDSKDMSVKMAVPETLPGGHGHFDSGNFTIFYKGSLICDSGVYQGLAFTDENGNYITNTKAGSAHDSNYHKRTIAHNCMLVHDPNEDPAVAPDGGQKSFKPFGVSLDYYIENSKAGEVLGYDYGEDLNSPSYTYLKGDIADAYSDKVKDYTRSFMFFNFFDEVYPGALIVYDKITSKDASFKKTWLLHFNADKEPEVKGNTVTTTKTNDGDNGRMINETLLPRSDNFEIEMVGGKGKEFYYNGKNWTAVTTKRGYDHGNWRMELSPKQDNNTDYFLNVIQVSDATLNPEPLVSELLETEQFYGVQIKDRVAFFSKSDGRTKENIEFTVKSSYEKLIYAVADVKEGEWALYKDGIKIKDIQVTEEGGVASFEGTPGSYKLVYNKRENKRFHKDFNPLSSIKESSDDYVYIKVNDSDFNINAPMVRENGKIYLPMLKHIINLGGYYEINEDSIRVFENDKSYKDLKIDNEKVKYINDILYVDVEELSDILNYIIEDRNGNCLNFIGGIIKGTIYDWERDDVAKIKNISGFDFEIDSVPEYAVDGEDSTVWKTNKAGSYLEVEFEQNYNLKGVEVSWTVARKHLVEVQVSKDGNEYTTIFDDWLDVNILDERTNYSTYEIPAEDVKFIRFLVKQNSTNGVWGNYKEIKFLVQE